jgi:branched-chain amino acid transport system substrate-binding protein
MRTRPRLPSVLVIALAVVTTACSGGGEPAAPRPAVAFLQDLSIEDPLNLVSPSFLALEASLELASERGVVDVPVMEQYDTHGDPAAALEIARTVAADDRYVAVVAAPFWTMTDEVGSVFADAGLAVLSLSDGPRPSEPDLVWRRFVAPAPAQANELAALATASTEGTVCVVSDRSARADGLAAAVGERIGTRASIRTPGTIEACGAVVWTGGPSGAAVQRSALPTGTPFFVSDAAKSAVYLDEALPASDGTIAVCPCIEATTATDLRARRFVNGYQAATGLTPGVFAAEGWEVAYLLSELAAHDVESPGDRAAYRAAIDTVTGVPGVGGRVWFDARGEPLGAAGDARASVAAGRRWLPAP